MRQIKHVEENMSKGPKFYGKALVGSKGQIVIPAEARKNMGIKAGDHVMIISGPPDRQNVITIMPEEEFNHFLKFLEDHLTLMKKKTSSTSKKRKEA